MRQKRIRKMKSKNRRPYLYVKDIMQIRKVNRKNKQEIEKIISLIYNTFLVSNKETANHRTKSLYKKKYWPEHDHKKTEENVIKSDIFLKAVENSKILGIIRWEKEKIINFYVSPKSQRKWIGTKLLKRFEKEAKRLGSKSIYLKSSKFAKEFYSKHWFLPKNKEHLIKYI